MNAGILRKKFLSFFSAKDHRLVESDSLVPKDDPTVLFTPAGMNQFKEQFMGKLTDFKRAATCQRCLRTDDLDKVGKTSGHHTFFEMLGNFSFGDYFKKEAISWAWEFLTNELKIEKSKLWISVYKDDEESYAIWLKDIKVSKDKIIKLTDKENFWPSEAKIKGPNGPCGPCSEIFYDWGGSVGCGKKECDPSCNCGRFVEVWNLVFTQFNRKEGGILQPLPKKNIDTGMGLERLTAVIEGVHSNFETDLFKPIIKEITSNISSESLNKKDLIYAIADHIRAIAFAIYDGVLPSNDGRGYVVRKLIRKSTVNLRTLGFKKPFLFKLIPVLAEIMMKPYPELVKRRENISEIILVEEKGFIDTLNSSDALEAAVNVVALALAKNDPKGPDGIIQASLKTSAAAGLSAFTLHDTHGIPLELTQNWWNKSNPKIKFIGNVYTETINKAIKEQKERSKLQSAMKGDVFDVKSLGLSGSQTKFLGYDKCEVSARILKIIKEGQEVKKLSKNDTAEIILDKTPFYPESGGQVGDTGEIFKGKNIFEVQATKKIGKIIVHVGKVKVGSLKKSDFVCAKINYQLRLNIARNHTATHLLQASLRKVLGEHVQQQGSLVAEDRLRFDFTHFKDIDRAQLDRIEELVNTYILNNHELETRQMSLKEAKNKGALAFFQEKYETKVRVISINDISRELCGGTHLNSTSQIGIFKIIREGSIASGIRRIEAVTGRQAYKTIKEEEDILLEASLTLNVPQEKIHQELDKRLSRAKELEKELNSQKIDTLKNSIDSYIKAGEIINGINVIANFIEGLDLDILRRIVDLIKEKEKNAIIALGTSTSDRQALLVIGTSLSTQAFNLDASKLVKEIAIEIGGSGGGRRDFAQAGGNNPGNFEKAFKKLKNIIRNLS